MRRARIPVSLLWVAASACSCPGGETDFSDAGLRCCKSSTTRTIRDRCLLGEVGLPLNRCEGLGPDGGDGAADTGIRLDGGAQDAGFGDSGSDIDAGQDLCGNGVPDPGEACEATSDCRAAELLCRHCRCLPRTEPVEVADARGDAPSGVLDIQSVVFKLDRTCTGNLDSTRDCIEMKMALPPEARPEPYSICLVIEFVGSEVNRLCYVRRDEATVDVMYTDLLNGERSVIGQVLADEHSHAMDVPHNLGLRLLSGNDYYVVSYSAAVLADRLPDAGLRSTDEIVGTQ